MATKRKDPKQSTPRRNLTPDDIVVTERRARYLEELSGVTADKLAGRNVSELAELLQWQIDPQLLLIRRVCGQVVKKNPLTGGFCPVPNATVHVLDTDCSFLGFFPVESPFFYLYPFHCSTEEIGVVTTDACGRFCVFLPYWDIDRILRFRKQRICFPDIVRPNIRDLIEVGPPLPEPPFPDPPRPIDPPPFRRLGQAALERVRGLVEPQVMERLEIAAGERTFGASVSEADDIFDAPILRIPPALPREFITRPDEMLKQISTRTGVSAKELRGLSARSLLGPFLRCRDVWVAEWAPILDVPDITFRVTQDVDGDGTEEVIYSEGYFDVRWNAPSNLNVTLEANASAICVPICNPVQPIPCGNQPAISTAGYMPLEATHHDGATGLATRVNRPVPSGDYPAGVGGTGVQSGESGAAPYAATLNLHGCHRIGSASHYRITHRIDGVGAHVPFTNLQWWAPRNVGAPVLVNPDANGWYPILNPAGDFAHPNWLLSWPTTQFPNGLYELILELGEVSGGSINVTNQSPARNFEVDNSSPLATFVNIWWRYSSGGTWQLLPAVCPVIERDPTRAIRIRVQWSASAQHFRNAQCTAHGCGAGNPTLVQPTPAAPDIEAYRHWHIGAGDNAVAQTNEFEIGAGFAAGCYTVRLHASSRAFNPSGFDYGPAANWFINQTIRYTNLHRSISVVDQ
jgi:hypothetical protein